MHNGQGSRCEEACLFVKDIDFKSSGIAFDAAFEKK
jgi:hypothetical protein